MAAQTPVQYLSTPCGPLHGELRLPGDKSISHRAVMLATLAEGESRLCGFLDSADTRATVSVLCELGARIGAPSDAERLVTGVGLHGLNAPNGALDCGNAGTAMRLLAGILSGQSFDAVLTGDSSLLQRPMARIIEPLTKMGAAILAKRGLPPLHIQGSRRLHGIDYAMPIASAQVKSAILLAGLYARDETVVREKTPTRDYTERMLAALGWPVEFSGGTVRLRNGGKLHGAEIAIPADFSSAAFFIVAAALVPGSELALRQIGINPRRIALLSALGRMGADIRVENHRMVSGEPAADLIVRHAPLHGIEIPPELVPDMIDEFPILFVAAATATGTTVIRGAGELRVKESDRIAVMASGLRTLGVNVREIPDGAVIEGGSIGGGEVDSAGDHRCAMSFAVAGAVARKPVRVRNCDNVLTSFPNFIELTQAAGMNVTTAV